MKPKRAFKPSSCVSLILMLFTFFAYGQQITRIDFGVNVQTTSGNWNNFTVQNLAGTTISLIDITGASTGEALTLTDVFDLYERNNQGTLFPTGFPFLATASRDSFFGERVAFDNGSGPSTEPTGGFTLSGLEIGKYYSFTIFASRAGVSDNRETLYTVTGNSGAQTATLAVSNNTSNVATILNVQPNGSGEIIIQATTGPNNNNAYGFYYIGAIEITKTDCSSTVTWNGTNWVGGTLGSTAHVIIADNYNTGNGGSQISFNACSLTVTNNATLIIADNTFIEVQNDIIVDTGSTINVRPYGSVVQINDLGTVINNGNISVVKKTAPMNAWYEYTYWSSPVFEPQIGLALSDSDASRRFIFKGQNFLDHCAETGNNNTLICDDGFGNGIQDDIDDNNNDWQWISGTTTMKPGIGYAATHSKAFFIGPPMSSIPYQFDYTFTGTFNNGIVTVPIYRNDYEPNDYNWNFIGNPYPSAIDVDLFLATNSDIATDVVSTKSISGAIFLWSQNTAPSSTTNGNQALNFSNDDYAIINAVGASAGGDGVTPSRFIPSGQGFFISMSNNAPATLFSGSDVFKANNDVVFNNSMRVKGATNNSQFFKSMNVKEKSNTIVYNKLWVNLTSDNGVFNQILVGYVNGATNDDDGTSYDTAKYPTKGSVLYTTIEGSNKKFAIQGKDLNSLDVNEVIKLGFKTTISVATLYKLSIAQLQGDFLTGNTVYLKDNLLNKLHNLSASDYTFTTEVGEFNNRFEIVFNSEALSTDTVVLNNKQLSIVELDGNQVQFNVSNPFKIKSVEVFDLSGRQLYSFKGQNSTETYRFSNLSSTVYIAKVTLSNGVVITKKAVKK